MNSVIKNRKLKGDKLAEVKINAENTADHTADTTDTKTDKNRESEMRKKKGILRRLGVEPYVCNKDFFHSTKYKLKILKITVIDVAF